LGGLHQNKPSFNFVHMKEMGILARDDKQFTLIYSGNTRVGKHTLSYLQGIKDKVLAINLAETKVADSVWVELADRLNKKVGDLVDKRVLNQDIDDTSGFSADDWLKIINNNDEVITQPIAINGEKTTQISNPTDVMKFFEVDSAGIEKTMHTEQPNIKPKNSKH